MIALSSQFEQANKLIKKYGKDNTGTIDYKFNSKGFRSYDEYIVKPDILFAGGSISFGIGVDESNTYKSILSKSFGMSYWDISYAGSYDNSIIYETIQNYKKLHNEIVIVQWVGDYRNKNTLKVYDYINNINLWFKKAIHIYIDKENKHDIKQEYFKLINTVWIDYSANFTHPGIKTHKGIAGYLERKFNES